MTHVTLVLSAFILDQLIGDPPSLPHPVILMGKAISWLEDWLNDGTPARRRLNGALMAIGLTSVTFFLTWGLLKLIGLLSPAASVILEVYLISTAIASKSLRAAGRSVLQPLLERDLAKARLRLSWLVSRDTSKLRSAEIVRGTVETLAENFVDGILSPLFYAAIGGAPLALAFKAVSTLDSMVGYKNERFRDFGRFSARMDDAANYIPARLSVPILLLAGALLRMPVTKGYKIWRRDSGSHPSPNGGNPESVVAGLLKIQLGGINIYHGQLHHRAEMGEPVRLLQPQLIQECLSLVRVSEWLALFPILALAWILGGI
ncbi:adenosylcobinamide-phosphate synthase CbiB [Paradesulfitobacterium ferrireducens]|uniref:adenosylcobinamide-phosphate synthase CbiB n=1 Tax=Paradesulfitobacterium ferrireducens TaxID=2816476 RepID=UPI001F292E42|nr:adenosylcobinamide-phosphate synthase CbiB [Paradesulfitobacterium ferrireducens]